MQYPADTDSWRDIPFNILLADDDSDDRYFFDKVLKTLHVHARLSTVEDGADLMVYLFEHSENLPDLLFLDLNMPRKNGSECLSEIKENEKLKSLPVVIYSTSMHGHIADQLYKAGAHYYIQKTTMTELKQALRHVFTLVAENNYARPSREQFIVAAT